MHERRARRVLRTGTRDRQSTALTHHITANIVNLASLSPFFVRVAMYVSMDWRRRGQLWTYAIVFGVRACCCLLGVAERGEQGDDDDVVVRR